MRFSLWENVLGQRTVNESTTVLEEPYHAASECVQYRRARQMGVWTSEVVQSRLPRRKAVFVGAMKEHYCW